MHHLKAHPDNAALLHQEVTSFQEFHNRNFMKRWMRENGEVNYYLQMQLQSVFPVLMPAQVITKNDSGYGKSNWPLGVVESTRQRDKWVFRSVEDVLNKRRGVVHIAGQNHLIMQEVMGDNEVGIYDQGAFVKHDISVADTLQYNEEKGRFDKGTFYSISGGNYGELYRTQYLPKEVLVVREGITLGGKIKGWKNQK